MRLPRIGIKGIAIGNKSKKLRKKFETIRKGIIEC